MDARFIHRRKGKAICPRALKLPVEATDDAILAVIQDDCLDAKMVDRVTSLAFSNRETPDRQALERQRDDLTSKIENLKKSLRRAMELGADFEDIAPMLAERKSELRAIERRLAAVVNPPDRSALRAAIAHKVKEWRETLRSTHLAEARLILQQLVGPIVVYEKRKGDTRPFVAKIDFVPARLLAEESVVWTADVNPLGLLRAADSTLLSGNHNRMASPTGGIPEWTRETGGEVPATGGGKAA
jgi:hypothetical protein